jgi:hypothetical protein
LKDKRFLSGLIAVAGANTLEGPALGSWKCGLRGRIQALDATQTIFIWWQM